MINQQRTIQRYLLGELPESEKERLEHQYFNDPQLFEQIVEVENELVDNYARGLLSAGARDRFEKYYLAHSKLRERAGFAEALAEKLGHARDAEVTPPPSERWWDRLLFALNGPRLAWAFAAVVLLTAVVTTWTLLETKRLRQELARAQSERVDSEQRERDLKEQMASEQLRADRLTEEIARLRAEQSDVAPPPTPNGHSPFATLILTIGGTREVDPGQPTVLVIPEATEQVRVQLKLKESDYPSYRAVVQSANGNTVFTSRRLSAPSQKSDASLALLVSARLFTTGDYMLTLRGLSKTGEVEDVSKSLFRVERRAQAPIK